MATFPKSLWLTLFVIALLTTFVVLRTSPMGVYATSAAGSSGRMFYLSKNLVRGGDAATACASGFHMASILELWDPAALKYDNQNGYTSGDSGEGPPAGASGWIRTGLDANKCNLNATCNCSGYTSSSSSLTGTLADMTPWQNVAPDGHFTQLWRTQPGGPVPGNQYAAHCDGAGRVWCVQN